MTTTPSKSPLDRHQPQPRHLHWTIPGHHPTTPARSWEAQIAARTGGWVATFVLLFPTFGSVVLPLKTIVMNVLSVSQRSG